MNRSAVTQDTVTHENGAVVLLDSEDAVIVGVIEYIHFRIAFFRGSTRSAELGSSGADANDGIATRAGKKAAQQQRGAARWQRVCRRFAPGPIQINRHDDGNRHQYRANLAMAPNAPLRFFPLSLARLLCTISPGRQVVVSTLPSALVARTEGHR